MNLKECRERAGYRQVDAAVVAGVSEQAYSCWERGTRKFSFEQAIKLAEFYGCTLDELAGRAPHMAPVVEFPATEANIHHRIRNAFDAMNSTGREAMMEVAESFLRVPALRSEWSAVASASAAVPS